jgi:serine/threonine-protein kinase HipA
MWLANKVIWAWEYRALISTVAARCEPGSCSQTVTLTPVYDVVCTRAYDELAQRMAMKIGGYYDPDDILPRHWERQCKAMGYAWPAMRTLLKTQGPALLNAFSEERAKMEGDGLAHPILSRMEPCLTTHIANTLNRINHD